MNVNTMLYINVNEYSTLRRRIAWWGIVQSTPAKGSGAFRFLTFCFYFATFKDSFTFETFSFQMHSQLHNNNLSRLLSNGHSIIQTILHSQHQTQQQYPTPRNLHRPLSHLQRHFQLIRKALINRIRFHTQCQ